MKLKPQFRFFSSQDVKIDEEKRTMDLSFSSEAPVNRWFGKEILSHENGAADFSRLNDGANVLFNHNPDIIIGVVEKAHIASDKRAYASIRFSKNEKAQEIMNDVKDGIIRNVSFGYEIKKMKMTSSEKDGETYTATDWMPFEVSFVSIPADQTVGVGREKDGDEKEVVIEGLEETKKVEETIIEGVKKMEQNQIDVNKLASDAVSAERKRIADISAIGEKLNQKDLARQLVEGGKSLDEARAAFLEKVGATAKPVSDNDAKIGLTEKETKKYSFLNIMRALANPSDRNLQEAASFEREISIAGQKHMNKQARGFYVPHDVMVAKRDMVVGTNSAGGYTVATDTLSLIELLRNKMALNQAGISVLSGLVGNVAFPKHSGASTAYHVAENAAPTESALSFGQTTMSPKTLAAFVDVGHRLLVQGSLDVEGLVRADMAQVMAIAFDYYALYGSGSSNQPTGAKVAIAGSSTEINLGAATPTFAEAVNLETVINSGNADIGSMKYICNASMAGALKTAEKASGYPQYILENGQINGYQAIVSNQSASGDIWFGAWSQLMLGFWGGLDILADPYSLSSQGAVRFRIMQDYDVALRHIESISRGNNTP